MFFLFLYTFSFRECVTRLFTSIVSWFKPIWATDTRTVNTEHLISSPQNVFKKLYRPIRGQQGLIQVSRIIFEQFMNKTRRNFHLFSLSVGLSAFFSRPLHVCIVVTSTFLKKNCIPNLSLVYHIILYRTGGLRDRREAGLGIWIRMDLHSFSLPAPEPSSICTVL